VGNTEKVNAGANVIKLFTPVIFVLSYSVCLTIIEKLTNYKHSSLLRKSVIYGQKKFYNIGPWSWVRSENKDIK